MPRMNVSIEELASNLEAKADLDEDDIFCLISAFNHELLGNVDGPNCTDRSVCNNNCCSIMIDIPHVLARKYIEQGRLAPGDVRRGDVFAWTLNVKQDTSKCVFFSPVIYGCRIYVDDLDTRPPQCAVYPAGYMTGSACCKAGAGPWIVKNEATGMACERLMKVYMRYCLAEREKIQRDLETTIPERLDGTFVQMVGKSSPCTIVGIKETWFGFEPLLAEGRSLSFKQFCDPGCGVAFLECKGACKLAADRFIAFLQRSMPAFIEKQDMKEEYTLMELKEFVQNKME